MNVPPGGGDLYVSGYNRNDDTLSLDSLLMEKSETSSYRGLKNSSPSSQISTCTGGDSGGALSGYESYISRSEIRNRRSSGSPEAIDAPIEVDFYRNPTILSRLILYNKFVNANKRCRDHPEEVAVWVCAKRKSNVTQLSPFYGMFEKKHTTSSPSARRAGQGFDGRSFTVSRLMDGEHKTDQQHNLYLRRKEEQESQEYSLRQLPIHIACTALAFTHDNTLRTHLEQLIVRLVVTFPEGCSEFDHGGKLPLHEAIWGNASPETIAMLLMAAPKSIDQRDTFGRTPLELNQRRTMGNLSTGNAVQEKAEVRDMLNLGVMYWDQARQEARLRMKLAVIPPSDESIASMSVVATSQSERESIVTTDPANFDRAPLTAGKPRKPKIEIKSQEIIPMAWEQLEQRALTLERLLATMYERNYELAGVVAELQKTKETLTVELEAARAMISDNNMILSAPTTTAASNLGSSPGSDASNSNAIYFPPRSPSVAMVPEDDEMSSVKLQEHAERLEHLESLVESFHSNTQKRKGTEGSGVSDLSFTTQKSPDGVFRRDRSRLARNDSLVSGLTASDGSLFDSTTNAVHRTGGTNDDENGAIMAGLVETDNLSELFQRGAEILGGTATKKEKTNPPSSRTSASGWTPPLAIPTASQTKLVNIPVTSTHSAVDAAPSPSNTTDNFSSVPSLAAWDTEASLPAAAIEEDSQLGSSTRSSRSTSTYTDSIASRMDESYDVGPPNYAVPMNPVADVVNSTMSVSVSVDENTLISENSTIVTEDNGIFSAQQEEGTAEVVYTPDGSDTLTSQNDTSTVSTMTTRSRIELMVFGRGRNESQENPQPPRQQQTNYNFDIRIPALDTCHDNGTGEI